MFASLGVVLRGSVVSVTAVAVSVMVGCTPGSLEPPTPATPETPLWFAGDSLGVQIAMRLSPPAYNVAYGAAGFTERAGSRIEDNLMAEVALWGAPEHILIMGGVIDTNWEQDSSVIIAAMQELDAAVQAAGSNPIWIPEPAWERAAKMAPLNAWAGSQPGAIDCLAVAGATYDGIHQSNPRPFADCVQNELTARGIKWDDPGATP